MEDNTALAKRFAETEEDRLMLKKALDKMEAAEKRAVPANTKFLSQRQAVMCTAMLKAAGNPAHMYLGGYENAERRVLFFPPDWMDWTPEGDESPIAVVRCEYSKENTLSHRDILGAMMGLGIERETVGDILVSEGEAFIIVLREILPFVLQNLDSAGRARLTAAEIPENELKVPEAAFTLKKDTVSSLRLDSVVSSGFNLSREKAAELIRSGRVSLNHLECTKPDKPVTQGAQVSARGFGKFELFEVSGLTKKGRTAIVVKKYV